MPLSGKNPPVDFGADLTIVLQASVEYHPSVAIGPPAGSDVFTLPADAAVGGQIGIDVAVRRAIDVQRSAGVTSVELCIRPTAEGFVITGIAGDGFRDRLAPTVRMVPSSNCLRADRFAMV